MPDNEQIVSDKDGAIDTEWVLSSLEKILNIKHECAVPDDLRLTVVRSKVKFLMRQQQNRESEIGINIAARKLPSPPVSKW